MRDPAAQRDLQITGLILQAQTKVFLSLVITQIRVNLKIPYYAFFRDNNSILGSPRIGLHTCILEIPLIILTRFISAKRSVLYQVALSPPPE